MKPDPTRFLEVAAGHLMARAAPLLPAYEQSSASVIGLLLTAVAEEFGRAAARRMDENRALRALFAEAAAAVEDAALAARLREAAEGGDPDLRVEALEATNADLRALLIELHAHVEGLASEAARRIEEAIWSELVRSTERRRLTLQIF